MLIKNTEYDDAFGGSLKQTEKSDFTILGIPFDDKTTFRKGTKGGPDAIREISTVRSISSFTEQGIDLYDDTSIIDSGNIDFSNNNEDHLELIEQHVGEIINGDSIPVTLGGDHSITYPAVKAVKNKYPDLNIVWIDAHPDIYEEYEGDKYSHACPLSRILELGGIENIVQGGIR
ncbi:MAG: arginase, partial [bacterium]|nr:arginase [bacterium]